MIPQRIKKRVQKKFVQNFIKINYPFVILFILIMILGIYTRLSYSFTHVSLPSIDPYGHLYVTKHLSLGVLYKSIGFYDDYPRGFHAIVSIIHYYSGLDAYTTVRFLGGALGLISIGSIYCLVSSIKDKIAGAFAAFIYTGIIIKGKNLSRIKKKHKALCYPA